MANRFVIFLTASFALLLTSCVSVDPITGPDGTTNQLITCPFVESCYRTATETCHGKYKIVNTSSELIGGIDPTASQVKILIKCDPDASQVSNIPNLSVLRAQNRCTAAVDKTHAFDCMIDQPDGSFKKVRYFDGPIKE